MKKTALIALSAVVMLGACDKKDKTVDRGIDYHPVSQLKAGIWVDPNGCQHWIIDDGLEGYLSQRLSRDGKPVCNSALPPNSAYGDFKKSDSI